MRSAKTGGWCRTRGRHERRYRDRLSTSCTTRRTGARTGSAKRKAAGAKGQPDRAAARTTVRIRRASIGAHTFKSQAPPLTNHEKKCCDAAEMHGCGRLRCNRTACARVKTCQETADPHSRPVRVSIRVVDPRRPPRCGRLRNWRGPTRRPWSSVSLALRSRVTTRTLPQRRATPSWTAGSANPCRRSPARMASRYSPGLTPRG
jgi:hypothetical protein